MKNKKKRAEKPSPEQRSEKSVPLQTSKTLIVPYQDAPIPSPATKQIHPRKTPPVLPKGILITDVTPTPPVELE